MLHQVHSSTLRRHLLDFPLTFQPSVHTPMYVCFFVFFTVVLCSKTVEYFIKIFILFIYFFLLQVLFCLILLIFCGTLASMICMKRNVYQVCYHMFFISHEFWHFLMNTFTTCRHLPNTKNLPQHARMIFEPKKPPRFWFYVLILRKQPSFALLRHACLWQTAPHVWSLGLQTVSADLRGSQGKLWQPAWCLLMEVNDLHQPDFLRDKQSICGIQDIDQSTFHTYI